MLREGVAAPRQPTSDKPRLAHIRHWARRNGTSGREDACVFTLMGRE